MGGTLHLTMYSGQVDQHTGPVCGSFRDIAVLYRLGAQAPVFEQELEKQGIPYQRAGKAGVIKGREGRTLLAILRLLKKPEDWVSLEEVRAGHAAAPKGFLQTIKKLRTNSPPGKTSVERIVDGLWDSAFFPLDDEEWKRAYEVVVGHSLAYGDDLDRFLKDMALEGEAETIDPAAEKVTLATLHAAKGLEFPVVFLTGCEEQLLPCRVGKEPSDPHEERRLLYVGMTRAGRLLYLTWSRSRFLFGETVRGDPSPFLKSIPEDTCETVEPGQAKKKNRLPSDPQLTLF